MTSQNSDKPKKTVLLETPMGEKCGNCYFCNAVRMEGTIEKSGGFFSSLFEKESNVREYFWCRRNAPTPVLTGCSEGTNIQRIVLKPISENGVPVMEDYWCGEWKIRGRS